MPTGTVLRSTGSHYVVRDADGRLHDLVARGQLRIQGFQSTNPVAVGDRVDFTPGEDGKNGTLTHVHDRRNYLVRRAVNLSHQKSVIAANLDQALLMVTLARPRTSTGFIDRFLVTAEAYEVPTVILFNKVDAYDADEQAALEELEGIYQGAGYRTLRTSAQTGLGVREVKELLHAKVSLLSGHSGVGKSTLINTIQPGLDLRTGAVSETTTKGQHTTTFAEMFELHSVDRSSLSVVRANIDTPSDNEQRTTSNEPQTTNNAPRTFIIDTPGIKGFGLVGFDAATIADQFPEFLRLKPQCRFASCTHLHEPGCAVLAALEKDEGAGSRYRSYVDMVNGVEEERPYRD